MKNFLKRLFRQGDIKPATVTISFEVTRSVADEMLRMEQDAEIPSHREMFANMLTLWRWAEMRAREGRAIVALDEATMRYAEVSLPALETLKLKALAERQMKRASESADGDSEPGEMRSPKA